MSLFASSLRSATRSTSIRTFTTSTRLSNMTRDTSSSASLTNTIRGVAQRAQIEAADDSFKAGVVYTLLGISALGAGYLIVVPKDGKTMLQKDLL
ncbi:hypothetical protein EJ08DRAFT_649335 [Tothia fuscella]|uniref:Uncharacterized protein n=1 Tax=Tothia fuscella TaxID=1048955 RepID=A0A9P4NSC4_9PEZI|nr:hypothetical protein EJ08DRAFT_649335 [Tothia fuscella]